MATAWWRRRTSPRSKTSGGRGEWPFSGGLPGEFFLRALLQQNNVSLNDLQSTDLTDRRRRRRVHRREGGCRRGVGTVADVRSMEEGNGKVLASTKEYPDLIVDCLAFNKEVVASSPEDVQKIVNAVLKAIEYWKAHPEEANQIMAPYFEQDAAKYAVVLSGVRFADLARNRQDFGTGQQPVCIFDAACAPGLGHLDRGQGHRDAGGAAHHHLHAVRRAGDQLRCCASGWAPVLLPARASRSSSPDDRLVAQPTTVNGTESLTGWRRPAALTAPFLILLGAWYTLTGNPPLVGAEFLPNPNNVGRAFVALLTKEFFVTHLLPSVLRVSVAFAFSVAVAFPLGVLVGQVRWVALLVEPFCGFTRYLPVAALVPLCILWFGIDDGQKVAVIVLGVVFQLVLLFATDTVSVPQELLEAGRTFGLTSLQIVTRIVVPWSLPAMWNDMRIAAGWAWSYLVLAELVAGSSGLGYFVVQSQRFLRTERVFAGILFIGILGLVTDYAFRASGRKLFQWQ